MAAAEILKLAHAVDNKVKEVDDKMDIVMKGTPTLLVTYCLFLIRLCWLDGKDTKVVIQQTSTNVDDMKCS